MLDTAIAGCYITIVMAPLLESWIPMQTIRNSRQRDAIQAELNARSDHPTAETLYQSLKAAWPSMSLGTVYRNLSQLCETGLALRLAGPVKDRYDGNTQMHCHFTCERCDGVIDLPGATHEALRELRHRAAEGFGGVITGCEPHFTGICPTCIIENDNQQEEDA